MSFKAGIKINCEARVNIDFACVGVNRFKFIQWLGRSLSLKCNLNLFDVSIDVQL